MSEPPEKKAITPLALTVSDAATLLAKTSGNPIEQVMLNEDVAEGAPTNPDGSINVVYYAAWLLKEMGKRAD